MRLAAVHKRYGFGPPVLVDVTMEVPAASVMWVRGANGSGKSTLLRVLAGVSRPTGGRVLGRPPVVGYVPERFPATDAMSSVAYLTHLGRVRGLPTRDAVRRAHLLLEWLALAGGPRTPMRVLSKGNAQKVALAQALIIAPALLVLDEPWSGLDATARGVLHGILHEVVRDGGTVVFSGHEPDALMPATLVCAVDGGRVSLERGGRR